MKYISNLKEGMHVSDVYLCKNRQIQLTKNGKEYASLVLQDKTGTIDAKAWDLASPGIEHVEALDYVAVEADVTSFNNALQLNIKRMRRADDGEYVPADYLPVSSRDLNEMYDELLGYIAGVHNKYLHALLENFFVNDAELKQRFMYSSAAKTVHHGYVGGLLEHTLGVAGFCAYMAQHYTYLKKDLLITAALCHDIGKTVEITPFPHNDYSDDGQLLGHIFIGAQMIAQQAALIDGFPAKLASELEHCILAHHGELEYGSPKKPSLAEALALHLADDVDSRLEIVKELFAATPDNTTWIGYNKFLESNIRKTSMGN